MSSSNAIKEPKCGNPYKALNIPNFSNSSTIKKAFRDLSRKLHPDKRDKKKNLTAAEHEALDKQFINVQEAKSFLLDVEHQIAKEKYDLKLKSDLMREAEEKRREEEMGSKRKSMKGDLQSKIDRELEQQNRQRMGKQPTAMDDHVTGLGKRGKAMRDEYNRKRERELEKDLLRKNKKQKEDLQYRQVRIKWSRAKMGGQSDDMIAKLLSDQFGEVESVELIGKKGNAAVVTFANADSCKPCVDAYSQSDKLRATYVGKRKEEEGDAHLNDDILPTSTSRERDRESVEERKLRQEAERERLLRQMEDEENGVDNDTPQNKSVNGDSQKENTAKSKSKSKSLFPPVFPSIQPNERGERLSYLEKLEQMERTILKDLIAPDILRAAQAIKL
mmetsp:Transcript_18815/g.28179  ORF Transcript_18815/g.28179 Transcript_18815/m.28179 type:complete len:389 (+) Transcript_18815:98-1264(+)